MQQSRDIHKIRELLIGAYDLHIHPAPSPFDRAMDDRQLLRAADLAGMSGILLKSHYEPTVERAKLAGSADRFTAQAYGTVVLNWPVGGLNPYAVHNALRRGAKIIFMPTRDAANSLAFGNMRGDFFERPGISILDENGAIKSDVIEIIDIIKQYDAALATGHLSLAESIALCREGIRQGVRMVLTHPEFERTRISADIQKELADSGVLIEKCWGNIGANHITAAEMAANIQTVGVSRCYLSTDRGQADREPPVEGMCLFLEQMLYQGITVDQIRQMIVETPRRVLGV